MNDPVAAKLLEIRDREGVSDAAMARRIGVDPAYFHRVIHGAAGAGRKLLDGAILAWPEVADVYAQSLTMRREAMAKKRPEAAS